jgi:hypothetical protein
MTSNPIGKTAHHDRGPLRRGGGLATTHAICLCRSDKATARGRRYGTVDFRFPNAGLFPPYWPGGDLLSMPPLSSPFSCAWVALFHAQAESTSCTARSQPYIVVQPADSIVRAACTTFRFRHAWDHRKARYEESDRLYLSDSLLARGLWADQTAEG